MKTTGFISLKLLSNNTTSQQRFDTRASFSDFDFGVNFLKGWFQHSFVIRLKFLLPHMIIETHKDKLMYCIQTLTLNVFNIKLNDPQKTDFGWQINT